MYVFLPVYSLNNPHRYMRANVRGHTCISGLFKKYRLGENSVVGVSLHRL